MLRETLRVQNHLPLLLLLLLLLKLPLKFRLFSNTAAFMVSFFHKEAPA
jgi:hypothetical protein